MIKLITESNTAPIEQAITTSITELEKSISKINGPLPHEAMVLVLDAVTRLAMANRLFKAKCMVKGSLTAIA